MSTCLLRVQQRVGSTALPGQSAGTYFRIHVQTKIATTRWLGFYANGPCARRPSQITVPLRKPECVPSRKYKTANSRNLNTGTVSFFSTSSTKSCSSLHSTFSAMSPSATSEDPTQYRLPTDVKPTHYDVTIKTDLENLTFQGFVKVRYDQLLLFVLHSPDEQKNLAWMSRPILPQLFSIRQISSSGKRMSLLRLTLI